METLGRKLIAWNKPLLWLIGLLDLSCLLYLLFQEKYFPDNGSSAYNAPAYMHSIKEVMIGVVLVIVPLVALLFYLSAALVVMSPYPFIKKALNLVLLLATAYAYFVLGTVILD